MPLRGTWHMIKQHVPSPAWVRLPEQQRFCGCCSIRTGASVIGWFDFIFNSLYVGMLLLAMTWLRNGIDEITDANYKLSDMRLDPESISGSYELPTGEDALSTHTYIHTTVDPVVLMTIDALKEHTLPNMYKSICIPGIMIIFSILWLITVEARNINLTRLFGRAFIIAIVVQMLTQLAFLIYVDVETRKAFDTGVNAVVWVVFVVYSVLNAYFIPIISEYIKRRIRECAQGMEQGLLTSEMYPRARVAEEYIQDAFTLDADVDMVQFQSSLAKQDSVDLDEKADDGFQEVQENDDYSPI